MTDLVACLSTGKGTWGKVAVLMKSEPWDKIFVVTNQFGKDNFTTNDKISFVVVDPNASIEKIKEDIISQLTDKMYGPEVAVNFISGSGKEHMALISALLNLGLGIRLVTQKDGTVSTL